MNYIHRLQLQRQDLESRLDAITAEMVALATYLQSDKFHCGDELDGYVNVKDVSAYVDRVRQLAVPRMI